MSLIAIVHYTPTEPLSRGLAVPLLAHQLPLEYGHVPVLAQLAQLAGEQEHTAWALPRFPQG